MAIVQISQITVRKGLQENLPQLAGGEFGWSQDTRQLYIGNGTLADGAPVIGNTEILTEFSDIINVNTAYTYKGQAAGYTVQTGPTAGDPVTQSLQSWLDQFATVKDFGAVGDGVTDDTDAINRALYQIFCREINPQIRRSLFFPAGTYRVTSPILIPPFATLYGEGPDNSVITLDDATASACVAQTADSLQQTGVNIGNNSALTPQYVTVQNLGFRSLDINVSVFLVEDASNFTFRNVGFYGPQTLTDITTETYLTSAVEFASSVSLVCDQILFDGCYFSGTTYGTSVNQQTKGVTFSNGKFDTLYRGIQLGTGVVVNGGPTGTRIVGNLFDNIYAEGIVIGAVSLNASGHNIFYDVGNHLGGTTTPYTSIINIQNSNNLSISDLFQRSDAYAGSNLPGTSYIRILLNNTQSIATTNGVQLALGNYVQKSGVSATLANASSGTITSINGSSILAFTITYSLVRGTGHRTGTINVATSSSDSTGDLTWDEDYVSTSNLGVTFNFTESADQINFNFTTTSSTSAATINYSISYLF